MGLLRQRQTLDRDTALASLGIAVLAFGILALFLRHPFPPLFDWPNHMARHHLEALALAGQPLPPGYAIRYGLMPNLGADLVMPALIALFGDTAASHLFLAGSVLLLWGAGAALIYQYAGLTPAGIAATLALAPWLLTATLFLGFLNSYSGCGVGILVAVHFIRLARSGTGLTGLVVHALLVVLTYLWHLSAFGIYGVLAASYILYELLDSHPTDRWRTLHRQLPLMATLLPTVLLALWVASTPATNALSGAIVWRALSYKVMNLVELFLAYRNGVDAAMALAWLLGLVLVFSPPPLRRPRLDYMGIAAFLFLTLAILLPSDIGLTYFVDKRPVLPLLICVCALMSNLTVARSYRLGLVALVLVALARLAYVDVSWAARSEGTRALLRHFEAAPKGARILVANTHYGWRRSFETQVAGWLVARNGAYVSNLWAIPGQQPLRHTMASYKLVPTHFLDDPNVLCTHAATIVTHFDYVWINDPTAMVRVPDGWNRHLVTTESALWQVRPNPGSCKAP